MALRRATVAMLILCTLLTVYPIVSLVFGMATLHFLTPISTSVGFTFALLPWVIAGWLKTTQNIPVRLERRRKNDPFPCFLRSFIAGIVGCIFCFQALAEE
jgi:hypothetical protein